MKICYVVNSAVGCTWAVEQLRELRVQYQCDVTACVLSDQGDLADALRAANVRVFASGFYGTGINGFLSLPRQIFGLARWFRRERFDVVQTHLFASMVVGRVAAWLADVPVRLAMIAGPYHMETTIPRWVDRSTCWMDTAVIASCEYTRQLYRELGVPNAQLRVIYYGPDEHHFDPERSPVANLRGEYGLPPDAPLIGQVAYFYPIARASGMTPPALIGRGIKGHDYLVRAMPRILAEFPTAKLLLIGGPFVESDLEIQTDLQALTARLGLQESVIITGIRRDVPACLRALDVSVQASLNENLGGTIESLLMERPLVATRVGGMVDSVRDGETGVLVEPANPDDLARGILQLLRDPEKARRLGRAGRKLMLERFTLRSTTQDLHALYDESMRARGSGPYRAWVSGCRLLLAAPLFAVLTTSLLAARVAYRIQDKWRAQTHP